MNRRDFLDELSRSLKGRVDDNELKKQIDYYASYIQGEIDNGRAQDEVLSELGDPRLIAKTIIQTYRLKDDPIRNQYREESSFREEEAESRHAGNGGFANRIRRVMVILVAAIVLLMVLGVLFSIFRFFLPIAFFVLVILMIVKFFSSFSGGGWK